MIENLKVQNIRNRFPKKKKGYCVTQFTMEFSRRKNKEASQQTKMDSKCLLTALYVGESTYL